MIALDLKPKAEKFMKTLPPKHSKQVKDAILSLRDDPLPHDSKKLVGYEHYMRIDIGEYRVIYRYEEQELLVTVVLVGKRNDDQIYKIAKRILK